MNKAKEYLEMVAEDAGPRKMYPGEGGTANEAEKGFASENASKLGKAGTGKDKAQRNADALNKYVHGDGMSHGLTPFKARGGKVVGGRPLLERSGDDGKRRHADGSVCKAQSPETCPFNKSAEAGEKAMSGREHAKPRKMYPFVEKKSEHPFMVKFPRHVAAETEDPKVMLKALEDAESAAKNSGPMTEADHEVSVTPRAPGGGGRMPAWVDTIHPREAYNQTVDAIIRNRYADEEVLRRVIGKGNKVSILDDIERQLKWGGYKNVSNSRVHELLRAPFQDKAQLG